MDLTNSKNVNWTGLEEHFHGRSIDCIPSNAREWNKFRRQYENAVDFITGLPGTDPTTPNITADDVDRFRNNILFLDLGYKKSPVEVLTDYNTQDYYTDHTKQSFKLSEFAEYGINWLPVKQMVDFFKYVQGVSIDYAYFFKSTSFIDFKFPRYILHSFSVNNSELESLVGCPISVGNFVCKNAKLVNLFGSPKYVSGNYFCDGNKITGFQDSYISKVDGDFYAPHNKIMTLEGMPEFIGGDLNVTNNPLQSIDDGRDGKSVVNGYIDITNTPVSKKLGVIKFLGNMLPEMIEKLKRINNVNEDTIVKSYADFMTSFRGGSCL